MSLARSKARQVRRAFALFLAVGAALVYLGAGAQGAFGPDNKEILHLPFTPERALRYGQSEILLFGRLFGEGGGIVRLRSNGSIDRSFGSKGFVQAPWKDAAVQRDGKILVLWSRSSSAGIDPVLTRLRPNGQRDRSFGNEGDLVVELGGRFDLATALALAPDGRIVIAGESATHPPDGRTGEYRGIYVIVRLLSGGARDRSFSADGRRPLPQAVWISSLAVARDGMIIGSNRSSLVKVRPTGNLETSFGDEGVVGLPALGEEFFEPVERVGLLPGGKVVVAGTVSRAVDQKLRYRVMAMRFGRDGRLDRSYGRNGYAKAGFPGSTFATSLAVVGRGRVVVAANAQVPAAVDSDAAAIVFGPDGNLAREIGNGGKFRVPFPGWILTEDIVRLSGGRIVLVGDGFAEQPPSTVLARLALR